MVAVARSFVGDIEGTAVAVGLFVGEVVGVDVIPVLIVHIAPVFVEY